MIVRIVVALFAMLCAGVVVVGGWLATDLFHVVNENARDYSTFIAFTITVNFALVVHRVRRWLFRSLRQVCNNRFIKAQGEGLKSLSENTGKTVCGYADVLQYVLKRRVDFLAWIAIICGPICAIVGMFLLVADVPRTPVWFVRCLPCLLVPSCIYYAATLSCYLCMIDHYNQICRGYVLYAKSQAIDSKAKIGDAIGIKGGPKNDGIIVKDFTESILKKP